MMSGSTITGLVSGIVGLAIISVVLSQQANTSNVLTSAFSGITGLLGSALSPLTGSSSTSSLGNLF